MPGFSRSSNIELEADAAGFTVVINIHGRLNGRSKYQFYETDGLNDTSRQVVDHLQLNFKPNYIPHSADQPAH
jgi:hypothetical protein